MPDIQIRDEDRQKAEVFLESFLTELIPDGDFSKGTVLRDHTITAISAVYALLQKEAQNIRNTTSLKRVANIEDDVEYAQAVENLVDNWFLRRRSGRRVRGTVTLHFSNPHNGQIPSSTLFTKQAGLAFKLHSTEPWFYTEADFTPQVDFQGEVTSYAFRVPVIAENVGTQYEVSAGPFSHATPFSSSFLFAENEMTFTGAKDPESPEELLARAPDALTKRDLGSNRAIRAVLQENFSDIDRVVIHGAGDEAMRRDVLENPAAYYTLHIGGHTDIYVSTPVRFGRVFEAEVGGTFADPRSSVTVFRDATVTDWRNLVSQGDILRIHNAGSSEPRLYKIARVYKKYLEVHDRQPFPGLRPVHLRDEATFSSVRVLNSSQVRCVNAQFTSRDVGHYIRISGSAKDNDGDYRITEVDSNSHTVTVAKSLLEVEETTSLRLQVYRNIVEYSIGDLSPEYANKIDQTTTGEFSRTVQREGVVSLPDEPIYRITEVSILDPDDPNADPLTDRVEFDARTNTTPSHDNDLQYQVHCVNPFEAPSSQQRMTLRIGEDAEATGDKAVLTHHADGGLLETVDAEFVVEDVGKTLRFLNAAHAQNRREFRVAEVVNDTDIVIEDPEDASWVPTPENRLSWELRHTSKYDGKVLRVRYDTVEQFTAIDNFVRNRENHIPGSNALVKAFHPVYLSFDLEYQPRVDADEFVDHDDAVRFLAQFVNNFPETDTITVSSIVSAFYTEFGSAVSHVQLPLTIFYTLYAPDGRVIRYKTQDDIALKEAYLVDDADVDRLEDIKEIGLSENTIRYVADESLVRVRQASE